MLVVPCWVGRFGWLNDIILCTVIITAAITTTGLLAANQFALPKNRPSVHCSTERQEKSLLTHCRWGCRSRAAVPVTSSP